MLARLERPPPLRRRRNAGRRERTELRRRGPKDPTQPADQALQHRAPPPGSRRLARLWTRGSQRFVRWDRGDVMVPLGLRGETPRYKWLEVPGDGASGIVFGFLVVVNRLCRRLRLGWRGRDRRRCIFTRRLSYEQQRGEVRARTLVEDVLLEERAAAPAKNQPIFVGQDELDVGLVADAALHDPIAQDDLSKHWSVGRLEPLALLSLARCG